jgi:hypothetical protein
MKRIRIRNKQSGHEKDVRPRYARILVELGRWEYADAPRKRERPPRDPQPQDSIDEMSYNDLRRYASENDIEVDGRKKDDYLRAIRYHRRDMRAG